MREYSYPKAARDRGALVASAGSWERPVYVGKANSQVAGVQQRGGGEKEGDTETFIPCGSVECGFIGKEVTAIFAYRKRLRGDQRTRYHESSQKIGREQLCWGKGSGSSSRGLSLRSFRGGAREKWISISSNTIN